MSDSPSGDPTYVGFPVSQTTAPITADAAIEERLRITEIFHSLQGEARSVGWPTVFVRLTGCPLRCTYCDTTYSFFGGEWKSIDEILEQVASYGARHVCVTGGEPLSQKRCVILLQRLCDAGYEVSLETSGAIDITPVDTRVSRVMDLKTPASNEMHRNRWENLALLTPHDQIKFVICDRADYEWARGALREHALAARCDVLFSPSYGQVSLRDLAEWILQDRLPVRLQTQLHKHIWGEEKGR
jgi:7-carboxy-7-deazaguanine synthase